MSLAQLFDQGSWLSNQSAWSSSPSRISASRSLRAVVAACDAERDARVQTGDGLLLEGECK